MTTFYSLPNLSSATVVKLENFQGGELGLGKMPKLADKKAFERWRLSPKTKWAFLSLVEGLTPGLRVTKENRPFRIHGFAVDFDSEASPVWLDDLAKKGPLPPMWGTLSFSGNVRAWWVFEQPLTFYNDKLHRIFMDIAFREVKVTKLAAGFNPQESKDPYHYFELGTNWTRIEGGAPLSSALVAGWVARAAEKLDWSREAPAVPFELVRQACATKYPGQWENGWETFEIGARGRRFWDPSADNMTAAIVKENGCVCWTGDKVFVPWSEILDPNWVRQTADMKVGDAVNEFYFDASTGKYWTKESNVTWQALTADQVKRRLAKKGLSRSVPKGLTCSEIDNALVLIEKTRSVDGVFPAFHRHEEVIRVNNKQFLNTSRITLYPADSAPHPTPEGFPWLLSLLTKMFGPEQLPYYLHLLAHFYRSCAAGDPERGLALFIAGPSGCGKTFLNSYLHTKIFGGVEDATKFLISEDQFNAHLFAFAFWCCDDAIASADPKSHLRFSQVTKAIVANDAFTMRGMYREGVRMLWKGRLCVTMNDDPESLRMLPSTEVSMSDKFMLLRAFPTFDKFPPNEFIDPELPHFVAYLRDMPIDPEIWIGGRFGIKPYHHPELKKEAELSQDTSHLYELVRTWAAQYFAPDGGGAKKQRWIGTAGQLSDEFERFENVKSRSDKLFKNSIYLGRALCKLIGRNAKGVSLWRDSTNRQYCINRPSAEEMQRAKEKASAETEAELRTEEVT